MFLKNLTRAACFAAILVALFIISAGQLVFGLEPVFLVEDQMLEYYEIIPVIGNVSDQQPGGPPDITSFKIILSITSDNPPTLIRAMVSPELSLTYQWQWVYSSQPEIGQISVTGAGTTPLSLGRTELFHIWFEDFYAGIVKVNFQISEINGGPNEEGGAVVPAKGGNVTILPPPLQAQFQEVEGDCYVDGADEFFTAHIGYKLRLVVTGGIPPYSFKEWVRGYNHLEPVDKKLAIEVVYESDVVAPDGSIEYGNETEVSVLSKWMSEVVDEEALLVEFTITDALGTNASFITPEGQPLEKPFLKILPAYGDLTGDIGVSAMDAVWVLQYVVGSRELTLSQIWAGDVSGNGTVSTLDAALILQYTVGLIDRFPVEAKGAPALKEADFNKFVAQLKASKKIDLETMNLLLQAREHELKKIRSKLPATWGSLKK